MNDQPHLPPPPTPPDTPIAWVLCADPRMFRFFEIELAHLGLEAVGVIAPDRPPCLAVVDSDGYALDALLKEAIPPDCPVVAFGTIPPDLPEERGVYLRRPFALPRLEGTLRRLAAGITATATIAPLAPTPPPVEAPPPTPMLEITDRAITVGGHPLTLTPAEAAILRRLHESRGSLVSREALSALLGGGGNSVEVYICHLRAKIEKPLGRRMIRTVRGQGYVLE